jgi:hypothetical protein
MHSPLRNLATIFSFLIVTAALVTEAGATSSNGSNSHSDPLTGLLLTVGGGVVGAWIAWSQARESKLHDCKAKECDEALHSLWTLTSNLPLRPINFAFSYENLEELSRAFRDWYFKYGHLVSMDCQNKFIRLQDLVIKSIRDHQKLSESSYAIREGGLKLPVHPLVYIHCQIHCSLVRQALASHFETRSFWHVFPRLRILGWISYGGKYCEAYQRNVNLFSEQYESSARYPWEDDLKTLINEPRRRSEILKNYDKIKTFRNKFRKQALHLDELHHPSGKR